MQPQHSKQQQSLTLPKSASGDLAVVKSQSVSDISERRYQEPLHIIEELVHMNHAFKRQKTEHEGRQSKRRKQKARVVINDKKMGLLSGSRFQSLVPASDVQMAMQSTNGLKISTASMDDHSAITQSPQNHSARQTRNFSEEALSKLVFAVNSNEAKSQNEFKNSLIAGSGE